MEQTKQEQSMNKRILEELQRTNALLTQILEAFQPSGAIHCFTPEESEEFHGPAEADDRKQITVRDRIELLHIASENQIGGVDSVLEGYQRIIETISSNETGAGEPE